MFRVMGAMNVPRTGLPLAGNLQYVSGKPWAATALIPLPLPQSRQQRVLLEPRGSRRLSSQTLLDIRLSRTFAFGAQRRIELMLDILNALNDTAEEGLVTDDLFGKDEAGQSNFGQPNVFVDPASRDGGRAVESGPVSSRAVALRESNGRREVHCLSTGAMRRNCSKKLKTKVRWSSGGFVAGASTNRSPSGCRSNMRLGPRV